MKTPPIAAKIISGVRSGGQGADAHDIAGNIHVEHDEPRQALGFHRSSTVSDSTAAPRGRRGSCDYARPHLAGRSDRLIRRLHGNAWRKCSQNRKETLDKGHP